MITQEQINQLLAAGVPAAQIVGMLQPAAPAAVAPPVPGQTGTVRPATVAALLNTEPRKKFAPYFDLREVGHCVGEIVECRMTNTDNGDAYVCEVEIVESDNPNLRVGSRRALFYGFWGKLKDAKMADAQAILSAIAEHQGGSSRDPQWFGGHTGDQQTARGLRLHIENYAKDKANSPGQIALQVVHRVLQPGESLGLAASSASAPTAAPTAAPTMDVAQIQALLAARQAQAAAPAPTTAAPDVLAQMQALLAKSSAPAPAAASSGLPATPPDGWPAALPWPPKVG